MLPSIVMVSGVKERRRPFMSILWQNEQSTEECRISSSHGSVESVCKLSEDLGQFISCFIGTQPQREIKLSLQSNTALLERVICAGG